VTEKTSGAGEFAERDARITDLVAVVALALVVYIVSVVDAPDFALTSAPLISSILSVVRVCFGLFVVLFGPGYVTFALLDPEFVGRDGPNQPYSRTWMTVPRFEPKLTIKQDFSWGERAIVSFLLSVVFLVAQGLFLATLNQGFQSKVIIRFTVLFIVAMALSAGVRRMIHYGGPVKYDTKWLRSLFEWVRAPPTRIDAVLNLLLVVLLLVGAGAAVAPSIGEQAPQFTEFALLTESDSGDLAAGEVSSALRPNGSDQLVVSITNQERATRQYILVVQVQRAVVGDRSIRVLNRQRIDRYETTLSQNKTETVPYRLSMPSNDSGCRLAFLLYIGDVPQTPTNEDAYHELHIWDGQPSSIDAKACPSLNAIQLQRSDTT